MPESNIQSVLREERTFAPPAPFAARARLSPADLDALRARAKKDPIGFWADLARRELHWHTPFTVTLDESKAPNYGWFTDGQLNVSWNCLDVHLAERGHKTALIFEGEPGDTRRLSYRELHAEVCRFANALKSRGVKTGDRVVIYMPLVPEIVIAMHACARIGAIHSVVFGGFSAPSLKDRIEDAGARLLITADGGRRGGHSIGLKAAVDKALAAGCRSIEQVIVYRRTGEPVAMQPGRDVWWDEAVEGQPPVCDPVWVDAEHPLFLLYTSGSTGKPKGIQHSSAGYLLGVKTTSNWVFDLREDDVYWCTADVGWVTGHSYVAYGPLAAGATVVCMKARPRSPMAGGSGKSARTTASLSSTPRRQRSARLMKWGRASAKHDLSSLRLLGTVGEPINPEAWMWYHRVIGGERCPVVDTWWQTETGAIMISPVPGVTPTKPGSCTKPLPGIAADIVDHHGNSVKRADAGGYLVIRRPWPSMLQTSWGDNERYLSTYWERFQNRFYVAGDSAHRDKDGYFWIMGRIDDVLNVAGHRLGTMEIESALVSHPAVAEAAVVGRPHEVKGESVFAFVVCRGERPGGDVSTLVDELRKWVSQELGAIARPEAIRFADNLPKTRSGKIMRRLLRAVARGDEITQDISTLENPAILDQLRGTDDSPTAKVPVLTKRTAAASMAPVKARKKVVARTEPPERSPPAKEAAEEARQRGSPGEATRKNPSRSTAARTATRRAPARNFAHRPRRAAPPKKAERRQARSVCLSASSPAPQGVAVELVAQGTASVRAWPRMLSSTWASTPSEPGSRRAERSTISGNRSASSMGSLSMFFFVPSRAESGTSAAKSRPSSARSEGSSMVNESTGTCTSNEARAMS
jgi:acetyl-CoA synthetase